VTVGYGVRTVSVSLPAAGGVAGFVVQLVDTAGHNISARSINLHAATVDGVPIAAQVGQPGNNFTFAPIVNTYGFGLSTRGLAAGNHSLGFTAGTDPTVRTINFRTR
jgi:hypothetical protein